MSATSQNSPGGKRLDSWKEIGAFFNRDERTVKRWESTRGLPVHRVPGGGRVYAYTEELRAWLEKAPPSPEPPSSPSVATPPDPATPLDPPLRIPRRRVSPVFVAIVAVLLIGGFLLIARPWLQNRGAPHTALRPADPKAEQLYLTGVYYWHKRTPESLNQAVNYFRQSIEQAPNYAPAYVGLADCFNLLREYSSMPSSEAYPQALASARKAISLDDSLSGAHSALAFAEFNWSWDFPEAEREFRKAIELSPNSAPAHHWYATSLLSLGRVSEAVSEINRAQALDPQSPAILADKALILYCSGQKKEAVSQLKRLAASEPDFLSSHEYLSSIDLLEGDNADHVAEARRAAQLRHNAGQASVADAEQRGLAGGGRRGMLAAKFEVESKLHKDGGTTAYSLAETCGLLGDNAKALQYLQESFANHEPAILGARGSIALQGLHQDPAFQDLLAKIGLPALSKT